MTSCVCLSNSCKKLFPEVGLTRVAALGGGGLFKTNESQISSMGS